MNARSTNCSRLRRSAAGLTLIEVVAGLALMATILTSVLYARTRYARAINEADRRVRACAAADAMLSSWRVANQSPSTTGGGGGAVPGDATLRWQTKVMPNDDARRIDARVVRLTIAAVDRPSVPLAMVETLVEGKAK